MKVIGHKEQLEKLKKIVETNQVSNAYIFEGIDGIGKFTIAKEFAKALLCINEGEKPCEKCSMCQIFEDSKNLKILNPEDNIIKVDEIRSIKEELMLKPVTSIRKVAIINNAEQMNEQAQNALLKILEEPPEYVTIILITSNKEKLLYTIKSRCTIFRFNRLTNEEIEEYFDEEIDGNLIDYSRGSIGTIIKAKENNETEIIQKIVLALRKDSLIEMVANINAIKEDKYVKENLQGILEYILFWYYQDMKKSKNDNVEAIEIVEEARNNILRNANVDIALDRMIINLWKWRKKCKKL